LSAAVNSCKKVNGANYSARKRVWIVDF